MNNDLQRKALTVSECVDLVRTTLQSVIGDIRVRGEVSEFQSRSSGSLLFFSLKDEHSYVRCFMLRHELTTQIEDGMEVELAGHPSLFKKNAGFHIRVREISVVGEGALRRQLELTKKKLEKEGLFSLERKRAIPLFPKSIGIITSEDAAAFTDVQRVVANRWPYATLTLIPSQVQGKPAIKQIIQALAYAQENVRPDIIILARGGGSLEDLQAFNSEELARVIFSSHIPIIVGIGHERDLTIADLVADVRAATPSNAAELAVPNRTDVLMQLEALTDGMQYALSSRLQALSEMLSRSSGIVSRAMDVFLERFRLYVRSIEHFGNRIRERVQFVAETEQRLRYRITDHMNQLITSRKERINNLTRLITSISPHQVLRRGFSITKKGKHTVRSSKEIRERDILTTTFHDGDVTSEVTKQP